MTKTLERTEVDLDLELAVPCEWTRHQGDVPEAAWRFVWQCGSGKRHTVLFCDPCAVRTRELNQSADCRWWCPFDDAPMQLIEMTRL